MFESLKEIDQSLFLAINEANAPLADVFFWLVSEGWIFAPFLIMIAVSIVKIKRFKYFITSLLLITLLIVATDQTANVAKKSIKRYRPTHHIVIKDKVHIVHDYRGGQYGFYSSHAANTFGVAMFLFLVVNWIKKSYRYLIFLWPLLVGYSRIYLGVHYPSDILIGALTGLLWGFIFYRLFLLSLQRLKVQHV
jgi:undecaprenyl-diphosphatase